MGALGGMVDHCISDTGVFSASPLLSADLPAAEGLCEGDAVPVEQFNWLHHTNTCFVTKELFYKGIEERKRKIRSYIR